MELPAAWKLFTTLTALLFPGIAVLALMSMLFNIMDHEGRCTTQHLTYMCGLYTGGKVQGPLCDAMCSRQLTIHQCLSNRPEKQVLHVSWEQGGPWDTSREHVNAILKLDQTWYNNMVEESRDFRPIRDTSHDYFDLTAQHAHNICMNEFESSQDCHNFAQSVASYADGDANGEVSLTESTNLLSLLRLREFFMLAALNDSKSTLDLLGYCGGFFAVQKVDYTPAEVFQTEDHILDTVPIFTDNMNEALVPMLGIYGERVTKYVYRNFQQVRVAGWPDRVNFINQSFGILYDFSFQYGTTIRTCDSHIGNFGIVDSRKVKYIDMDMVISTKAAQLEVDGRECETDEDCEVGDFDDCSSKCDEDAGRCHNVMKTNDLHNFCRMTLSSVLLKKAVVLELGVKGKVIRQLSDLVQQCVELPLFTTAEDFRKKGVLHIWNKFNRILQDDTTVH